MACNDFFGDLSQGAKADLEAIGRLKKFTSQQILVCEEDALDKVFYILQGKVKLTKKDRNGREVILKVLQKGDFIGELSLLADGVYPYDVEALEPLVVYVYATSDLKALMKKHNELLWRFTQMVAGRLEESYDNIKFLALKDSYGKISSKLFHLSKTFGVFEGKEVRINLKMSRHDFANFVGLSRETTSIILNQMEKEDILKLEKKQIVIKDLRALQGQAI